MRRRVVGGLAGVVAVALVPSIVASRYSSGPGGAQGVAGRPLRGWEFIVDAVEQSRNAQLGSGQSALERARNEVWAGRPAVADSVELVWNDGPFAVPVPDDGHLPAGTNRVALPDGSLAWVVTGRFDGGPEQMIGLLDYDSGRVLWDIRRLGGPR